MEFWKCFIGKLEYVINFFCFLVEDLWEIMVSLGFCIFNEMVGKVEMFKVKNKFFYWKYCGLDFSFIFYKELVDENVG